jgi:cytochrome b561
MFWNNTKLRYGGAFIAMHWLMLILLVAVYACMELRGMAPRGSALRAELKPLHFSLGLCVLALIAVRLWVRWTAGSAPDIVPPMPVWQTRLAQLMSLALYAFMACMPILGWLALSAAGKPVPFFGLDVPALITPSESLADRIKGIHEALANVGYFLIGLHAAAGLFHHYVLKDNTLRRIWPGQPKGPQ